MVLVINLMSLFNASKLHANSLFKYASQNVLRIIESRSAWQDFLQIME